MFDDIVSSGKLFNGQYIYIVAKLNSIKKPKFSFDDSVRFPPNIVNHHSFGKKPKCVWGGASKGVIFSLFRHRCDKNNDIKFVVDISPAKQGKYLAATGLLIQHPVDMLEKLPKGSIIFVMNSNYMAEIKEISNYNYKYIGIENE
jgi:hypothetical protein